MGRIDGYNVAFKVGTKDFIAVTNHNFDLTMKEKTSITKDDQGTEKTRITGHSVAFSVEGISETDGTSTTKLDRDAIIALALAKSPITYVYSAGGAKSYTGTAVITSYSEKSGADDELTYTLNIKGTSDLSEVA